MEKNFTINHFTNDTTDDAFLKQMQLKSWLKIKNNLSYYFYRVKYRINEKITYIDSEIINLVKTNKRIIIVLDDSLEAYAYRNFKFIDNFVSDNELTHKVMYISAHFEVENEYALWLTHNKKERQFKVCFFNRWLSMTRDYFYNNKISFSKNKSKWFCCLNHRPHQHRILSLIYLDYLNLLDAGIVTGHDKYYETFWPPTEGYDEYTKNVAQASTNILLNYSEIIKKQSTITQKKLPLIYDINDLTEACQPFKLTAEIFNDCLINLVTETFYFGDFNNHSSELFITEKTVKAILSKQIFILIGPKGMLKKLKSMGITTFSDYIDESYDDEPDSTRLFKAIDTLKYTINNYSIEELNKLTLKIRNKNYKVYNSLDFNINLYEKFIS